MTGWPTETIKQIAATDGGWYKSAIAQRAGKIAAAGQEHEVRFTPITDPGLNERIDAAYDAKYAGSPYLPPMVSADPKAATVEATPLVGS